MEKLSKWLITLWIVSSMVPAHGQSLLTVLENNDDTAAFALAIKKCGLEYKLTNNGPFTLLVPSNEPMQRIMDKYDTPKLKNVLMNHIMTGMATENSIRKMSKVTTLGGLSLIVKARGNTIEFNNSRMITSNIKAKNGIIHLIDQVLL